MRFRLRQLKLNKKLRRAFVFFIVLSLGIGFAYIQSDLNINTFLTAIKGKWEINVGSNNGNFNFNTDDDKHINISFDATLNNLEESYTHKFHLINAGTIDAELYDFEIKGLSAEEQQYLDVQLLYEDDQEMAVGDGLDATTSETLKVVVKYKDGSPVTNGTYNITLYVYYDKSDGYFHRRKTLYNVLEQETTKGTLARKYTGEHQDSFTEPATKDIYHWYANNDTDGNKVTNMNNVIFGNQCWQMIRTTDTGGVKMIYNGEPENNKCLNTRGTHVGYASRTSQNLASNYWYGTDYTYDSTAKTFKVSGTTEQTMWNESNGPGLVGKYTCKLTSEDGSCSTLYLVESYYNTTSAYVIPLNSNSNYSQFGTLQFNASYNSPSYVGYMYNTVYPYKEEILAPSEIMLSSTSINTNYWYADTINYGLVNGFNKYSLVDPYKVSESTDYSNLIGKYTFKSNNQSFTNTNVAYIVAVNSTTMYYVYLKDGNDYAYYNDSYTYGKSYTDNGNGTYTIDNPTTINRFEWLDVYGNVGSNTYICKNAINDTCEELWYTTDYNNRYFTYIKVNNFYKYSKGFTWDGNKYVLDSTTSVSFWNVANSENRESLNNAHYTCFNLSGECTTISYIYELGSIWTPNAYYVNLSNGKNIDQAVNEMLYNDDVNAIDSTIKKGIDIWYEKYILNYSNYLEDTIFCNNRKQANSDINGWNPAGGNLSGGMNKSQMTFIKSDHSDLNDLSCPNVTDRFSTLNEKAKLKYKVGLMTTQEIKQMKNITTWKTGNDYWVSRPYYFGVAAGTQSYAYNLYISDAGSLINNRSVNNEYGVRPAISLVPNITAAYGDGSMEHPYYIDTSN